MPFDKGNLSLSKMLRSGVVATPTLQRDDFVASAITALATAEPTLVVRAADRPFIVSAQLIENVKWTNPALSHVITGIAQVSDNGLSRASPSIISNSTYCPFCKR